MSENIINPDDMNTTFRWLSMLTGQSRFTAQSQAEKPELLVVVYPSYVTPWVNARPTSKWLEEVGLSSDVEDSEAKVAIFHWNGTMDQIRELPPSMVRWSSTLEKQISREQWEEIRGMGHLVYYEDPDHDVLMAWLRKHGYIE